MIWLMQDSFVILISNTGVLDRRYQIHSAIQMAPQTGVASPLHSHGAVACIIRRAVRVYIR
eukprot:1763588-Amphidinium_carterae.1